MGTTAMKIRLVTLSLICLTLPTAFVPGRPSSMTESIIERISEKKRQVANYSVGKYSKIFRWEYERPVDGRGTFCEPCVGEDKEAITFIKKYFMK
jgi:hypothetical protein